MKPKQFEQQELQENTIYRDRVRIQKKKERTLYQVFSISNKDHNERASSKGANDESSKRQFSSRKCFRSVPKAQWIYLTDI